MEPQATSPKASGLGLDAHNNRRAEHRHLSASTNPPMSAHEQTRVQKRQWEPEKSKMNLSNPISRMV